MFTRCFFFVFKLSLDVFPPNDFAILVGNVLLSRSFGKDSAQINF